MLPSNTSHLGFPLPFSPMVPLTLLPYTVLVPQTHLPYPSHHQNLQTPRTFLTSEIEYTSISKGPKRKEGSDLTNKVHSPDWQSPMQNSHWMNSSLDFSDWTINSLKDSDWLNNLSVEGPKSQFLIGYLNQSESHPPKTRHIYR